MMHQEYKHYLYVVEIITKIKNKIELYFLAKEYADDWIWRRNSKKKTEHHPLTANIEEAAAWHVKPENKIAFLSLTEMSEEEREAYGILDWRLRKVEQISIYQFAEE